MKLWEERSFLEQGLLLLLLCLLLVILGLSITVGVRNKNGWGCPDLQDLKQQGSSQDRNQSTDCRSSEAMQQYCTSAECISFASDLLSSVEQDTDPCEDFYGYACNSWIEKAGLGNRQHVTPAGLAVEQILLTIKRMLEEDYVEETIPEHFLRSRNYYNSCMNWVLREEMGVQDFLDDLEYAGGFPLLMDEDQWNASTFNYVSTLVKLWDRGFLARSILSIDVKPDARNTSKMIIALGTPEPGVYPLDLLDNPEKFSLYVGYLMRFTDYLRSQKQQTGNSSQCSVTVAPDQSLEFEQIIQLQRRLAQIVKVAEALKSSKTFMKVGDLQATVKEVDWLTLIRMQLRNYQSVDPEEELMLDMPLDQLKNLSLFLKDMDSSDLGRRTLANYMMWHVVMESAAELDQRMRTLINNFKSELNGWLLEPQLWEQCIRDTVRRFRFSLTNIYATSLNPTFSIITKPTIERVISQVKSKIKKMLNDSFWMDDGALKIAVNKIEKLYITVGYPQSFLNEPRLSSYYKKLSIGDYHYENARNSNSFLKQKLFGRIGKAIDRSDWELFPEDMLLMSSLYYSASNNSAYIPLSWTQSPFFDEDYPLYVNYGRLGVAVGQILSRAVDSQGSQVDGSGNLKNWWKDITRNRFANKTQCFIKLYNSFFIPTGNLSLDGQKLLLQNIALDSALKESYKAFKQELNEDLTLKIPGLALNPRQLFWLSFASASCELSTTQWFINQVRSALETPARFRVNGPLSMNKNFARDFVCPFESTMRTGDQKCRVWGI